jgi:hypothetical protein
MKYFLEAMATWTESYEQPQGNRRDVNEDKTKELSVEFDSNNIEEARGIAKGLLLSFQEKLPKEREGSLSWNSKPEVKVTTFAKIHKL